MKGLDYHYMSKIQKGKSLQIAFPYNTHKSQKKRTDRASNMQIMEVSPFETSEMLATFLASTPLLEKSWKLCHHANTTSPQTYVIDQIENTTYLAFSGVQAIDGLDPSCRNLVPIEIAANGVFSSLHRHGEGEKPVMVHSGLLNLFLSFYGTQNFRNQMLEIIRNSKSVVITGHSIGGTLASLSSLWLLSHLQSISYPYPFTVICITYGSPMLGNESFSRTILQERWGGNFFHVVERHDIVPRLLYAPPSAPIIPHLSSLFSFWHLSMSSCSPYYYKQFGEQICEEGDNAQLFHTVLKSLQESVKSIGEENSDEENMFWPFGNYIFSSSGGSICLENGIAILKLLLLMLLKGSPSSSINDHLNYDNCVRRIYWQILSSRSFIDAGGGGGGSSNLPESSYEAGITLALQASDISSTDQVSIAAANDCLKMAKQMGCRPNLNCANLAIRLSKINPLRAQIEWYKATCDDSDDQLGYYDSFKQRGASKKDFKVNMNRMKLSKFWDEVIAMLERNQLPYDFHKRSKWVNAAQFYKLLVEPLDIAEYYRRGEHLVKGHYMVNGRERRYTIFDKWWNDQKTCKIRRTFASLTQDSCFWARVEEARDWLNCVRSERDPRKQSVYCDNINKFYQYSKGMIDTREVSKDVLAKNSSYNLFVEEWRGLKSQLHQLLPTHFPAGFLDGEGSSSSFDYILGK